jgi:hypothetical protein
MLFAFIRSSLLSVKNVRARAKEEDIAEQNVSRKVGRAGLVRMAPGLSPQLGSVAFFLGIRNASMKVRVNRRKFVEFGETWPK